MSQKNTLFDSILSRIKNNPVGASILVSGVIIISLATFTGALKTLLSLSAEDSPEAARVKINQLSLKFSDAAFVESAEKGDILAVELFLLAKMSPDVKDKKGNTALMYAISKNQVPVINALIKAKANVNEKNRYGGTALLWAVDESTLRILLNNGADANAINLAFIASAKRGKTDFLRILLNKGAAINKVGLQALKAATTSRFLKPIFEKDLNNTVEYLLDTGVDVNEKDKSGWTGLLWSAKHGKTSMAQTLLNRGADVNARCECPSYNNGGWTALMIAVKDKNNKLVSLLLSKRADINKKNKRGETALIIASHKENTDAIRALVAAGAGIDEKDNAGRSAISIARNNKHTDIIKLLKQTGR